MRRAAIFFVIWFLVPFRAFAAPTSRDPTLSISEIASGLSAPTTMAFIGPQDILVLQKADGRVRRVMPGSCRQKQCWMSPSTAYLRGACSVSQFTPNFPLAHSFIFTTRARRHNRKDRALNFTSLTNWAHR